MGLEWCCTKAQEIHPENSLPGLQRFLAVARSIKNVDNAVLSLGKRRWVEHFHDNHHRFSPQVALILTMQRRSRVSCLLRGWT